MKRIAYFDNARAILIILVVFGHMLSEYLKNSALVSDIYLFIYTFHMPAFVLVSGYFAKKVYEQGYFQKLVKKLLVPYLIFQVLYTLYYDFFFNDIESYSLFVPRWALWFLLSLFCWNVLLFFFGKMKYGMIIALFISLIIGYDAEVNGFLSLSRTFYFFPFFLAGYYLQLHHFERIKSRFHIVVGTILALTGFALIAHYVPIDYRFWLLGKRPYEEITDTLEYAAIMRLATYGVQFLATYIFFTLVPKKQNFLTSIGQKTMIVYLLHMAVVRWFHEDPFKQFIVDTSQYWILFVMSLLVIYFLSRRPVVHLFNILVLQKPPLKTSMQAWAQKFSAVKIMAEHLNRSKRGVGKNETHSF